jgi:hypothetical protein
MLNLLTRLLCTGILAILIALHAFVSPGYADTDVNGACGFISKCSVKAFTQPKDGPDQQTAIADPVPEPAQEFATCTRRGEGKNPKAREVDCQSKVGAWNEERQCYIQLHPNQDKAVEEFAEGLKPSDTGAYYLCNTVYIDEEETPVITAMDPFWAETPPTGITQLTPGQAATQLIQSFELEGVNIGLLPRVEEGRRGAVGLPVWMWVDNPTERNWGPWTKTDTIGGVTVTATAKARNVVWSMGDGQSVLCNGMGTPWDGASATPRPSPDCGYVYATMSPQQGRVPYTVTAQTNWVFEWSGGGESGVDTTQTEAREQVLIGELQSVNVNE